MTKCDAIIGLHRAGTPISKIIKQLKVPKTAVYDAMRRYKELGDTKGHPKSGCPRSCRTKSNIMRKIDFKIDPKSMMTIVKTVLKHFPL